MLNELAAIEAKETQEMSGDENKMVPRIIDLQKEGDMLKKKGILISHGMKQLDLSIEEPPGKPLDRKKQ